MQGELCTASRIIKAVQQWGHPGHLHHQLAHRVKAAASSVGVSLTGSGGGPLERSSTDLWREQARQQVGLWADDGGGHAIPGQLGGHLHADVATAHYDGLRVWARGGGRVRAVQKANRQVRPDHALSYAQPRVSNLDPCPALSSTSRHGTALGVSHLPSSGLGLLDGSHERIPVCRVPQVEQAAACNPRGAGVVGEIRAGTSCASAWAGMSMHA